MRYTKCFSISAKGKQNHSKTGMAAIKFGFTATQIVDEGRVNEQDIQEVRDWVASQDCPKLTDEQIVLFLISCCNDQALTRKTIKAFYSIRSTVPELFRNRSISDKDVQKQAITLELSVLPQRTEDGCAIVYGKLYDTYYVNYTMEHGFKLFFMTLDAATFDYPPTGLIMLLDMKGVGLMHLTRLKLHLVRAFFQYVQEALPAKLKNVHVLNTAYFLDKVLAIIKPFIKKEVMDLVHFHPPWMDMELFSEKWLPKKCLPAEYGGDLPSVRTLHEENNQKLADMEPYFEAEELQRCSKS